jgi:hypothetical protein
MNKNPFEILSRFADSVPENNYRSSEGTAHFLSKMLDEIAGDEFHGQLPPKIETWLDSYKQKVCTRSQLQLEERLEETAENVNACIAFYSDVEDIAYQQISVSTRGSDPTLSLLNRIDDELRGLDACSSTLVIECEVKLSTIEGAESFLGAAIMVPVVAASENGSHLMLGVAVFLVKLCSVNESLLKDIELECIRLVPHAWVLRSCRDPRQLLPVDCGPTGWTTDRYARRLCRFFVEHFCPKDTGEHFASSLWYQDDSKTNAYVRSTYGYDYCFQKRPLVLHDSAIGEIFANQSDDIARVLPSDPVFKEKDKALMAGLQVMHGVRTYVKSSDGPMVFTCHCFDPSWKEHSPKPSIFRGFANLVAKVVSHGDNHKKIYALMDLDWRFRNWGLSNNGAFTIEDLCHIIRDRLSLMFATKGCTIFLAEKHGTDLYPISTFGLQEDRLQCHEGRLIPERRILSYTLTEKGLLKLFVELPDKPFIVNDQDDFSRIQKCHQSLVRKRPRLEFQESGIASLKHLRVLGIGLSSDAGPKFVIRITRPSTDPPFRKSDANLLAGVSMFLQHNRLWRAAVMDLAEKFTSIAPPTWPSSCERTELRANADEALERELWIENCDGVGG